MSRFRIPGSLAALTLTPLLASPLFGSAPAHADSVLRGDEVIELAEPSTGDDLWMSADELHRASGFKVKPEGLCLESLCVPVRSTDKALVEPHGDAVRVNSAELARRLGQSYARDDERRVWSFAPVPATVRAFTERGVAPDVELRDRAGKQLRLSDFRGKKLVVVTWASWCACREDLPVWQSLYEELHPQGLEILTVAQDTGGEAAAGPHIDAAHLTLPAVIDPVHAVTAAFHLVNVPTAIWIDEQGTIVRLDQGAYPKSRRIVGVKVGADGYDDALRDWVKRGAQSPYALPPEKLTASLAVHSRDLELADQEFRLGAYFYQQGDRERATAHWSQAERLAPDNWNYHRQEWADSRFNRTFKFLGKAFGRGVFKGIPYYDPIELPKPEAEAAPAEAKAQ